MSLAAEKVRILDHEAIQAKLRRIAYEIHERNFDTPVLCLAGVNFRGAWVARELMRVLAEISQKELHFLHLLRDPGETAYRIVSEMNPENLRDHTVLVVDDVLYSGRTLFDAVATVLRFEPARIETAVLINRGHRNYPVAAEYTGLRLATTLRQYVFVEVNESGSLAEAFLQ